MESGEMACLRSGAQPAAGKSFQLGPSGSSKGVSSPLRLGARLYWKCNEEHTSMHLISAVVLYKY